MKYSMEHEFENERLKKQNKLSNYNIDEEIKNFIFNKGEMVLDAGCGGGDVHRAILRKNPDLNIHAFDFSELRLKQAEKTNRELGYSEVHYFQSDIYSIKATTNTYDRIVCRFVLEHLERPLEAISELKRVLKIGGHLYIIDLDGILFNIDTNSKILKDYLNILKNNFSFDLYIGRKIPGMCKKLNLIVENTQIQAMHFVGTQLIEEIMNYKERLYFAKDLIVNALGSELKYTDFCKLYIDELENGSTLFYNKFIVDCIK